MSSVTIRVYLNRKTQERFVVIDDYVYGFDVSNPRWQVATEPDVTFALHVYSERDSFGSLSLAEYTPEELGHCTFVGIIPESLLNGSKTIETQPSSVTVH